MTPPPRNASLGISRRSGTRRCARAFAFVITVATLCSCSDNEKHPKVTNPDPVGGPSWGNTYYPDHQVQPSWSKEGLIAYRDNGIVPKGSGLTVDTSLVGIWILNPKTGEKHRLLPFGSMPAWSNDGTRLAFIQGEQLYVVSADGGGLHQLTRGGRNYFPAWHPSDSSIVFDSSPGQEAPDLWIVTADGSELQRFCPGLSGRGEADWVPDGSGLTMVAYDGDTPAVYLQDATCNVSRLTGYQGTYVHGPRYSPDGSQIVFTSDAEEGLPNVWIMEADGTGVIRLTTGGGEWPDWSPDGSEIIYTRSSLTTKAAGRGVLWALNLKSMTSTQITSW